MRIPEAQIRARLGDTCLLPSYCSKYMRIPEAHHITTTSKYVRISEAHIRKPISEAHIPADPSQCRQA